MKEGTPSNESDSDKSNENRQDGELDEKHKAAVKYIEAYHEHDFHQLRLYLEAKAGIKKGSKADRLTDYVFSHSNTFFYDITGDGFIQLGHDGIGPSHDGNVPPGIYKVKSKEFRAILSQIMWKEEMKAAGTEAVSAAAGVVEARARFEGKLHQLYNRVAPETIEFPEGLHTSIWYDLCNKDREAVHINKDGWRVEASPPILFRRFNHQQPQDKPDRDNADARLFLSFLNVESQEEQDLILVDTITKFVPDIPHSILVVLGPQGSAKSKLMELVSMLVDPSSTPLLIFPRSDAELALQVYQHWLSFYDNIDFLPDWIREFFCSACTGIGYPKRELYTDEDSVILTFIRCMGINGISPIGMNSDFLDRSTLIKLNPIPQNKRLPWSEVKKRFLECRPRILGGVFNVLSKALRILPELKLDNLPRMADYTVWGCAIAEALGIGKDRFLSIYRENIGRQVEETIQSSPVAQVLLGLLDDVNGEWKGTALELLGILNERAENDKINTSARSWPKGSQALSRQLGKIQTDFMSLGYYCDFTIQGHKRLRFITISKSPIPKASKVAIQGRLEEHSPVPEPDKTPAIAVIDTQKIPIAIAIAPKTTSKADLGAAIDEIDILQTNIPLSNEDQALLGRLERYMEAQKSVGAFAVAKNLEVDEKTLARIAAMSSKVTWSRSGVIDWKPRGEKVEWICATCRSKVTAWPAKDQLLLTLLCPRCGNKLVFAKLKVKCTIPTCGTAYSDWFPENIAMANQKCAICKTPGFLEAVRDQEEAEGK